MNDKPVSRSPETTVSYSTALKYAIFLGWIGADRFYIGDTVIGICKALTLSFYGLFWIVDIIIIRSHKDDWDEWIGDKQAKRTHKKAETKAAIESRQEVAKLAKERAANGQCPECGSNNLTAVSETTNKLSFTGAMFQLSDLNKHVAADKIVSVTKRVCLNCGNKF